MVTKFRRYWQIADILFKYEYGIFVQRLFPGVHRFRRCRKCPVETVSSEYARARLAIEELGPTYIKFGQILSTRQDLLPPGLIKELKKLQDHTNPLPFETIRPVIEAQCPQGCGAFSWIDETPLASASIAQVHRARLQDGTEVVLKVRRPGIQDIIETDLVILENAARRSGSAFPEWKVYNPEGLVGEFAVQIRKELDFVLDGKNADRLRKNMREVEGVRVPFVYWEYSTPELLVMEFIDGVRVDDLEKIAEFGVSRWKIAEHGFNAYMTQIFEDGFFHGDPHPGNLLVTRDGELVFLDFGIVGIIRPERRIWFIGVINSMVEKNPTMLVKSLESLGVIIPEEYREDLRDDLYVAMLDSEGTTIGQYSFSGMANGLTDILRKYQIVVPSNLMLMLKVIIMVLDVGVTLDPKFDFLTHTQAFMGQLSRRSSIMDYLFKRGTGSVVEAIDGLLDTPRSLNMMVKQLATGAIKLDIEHEFLHLQDSLERTSDKILIGLIIAGMLVGSSYILQAATNLIVPDIVVLLSSLTYIAAIIIGFYAVYHVLFAVGRQRK
ncbi:ubiquinone biosynthesis protein [Methanolinea mesophila]|uniref:ABC1 kinase family protein n=1 Tax=Methanolinea mesophila TaxID=547055 RepID=UPI001AE905EA|nr:AarF/UbiB family protein [Methanolinea mesophila]MBP1929446.1 ubiquinone biosynthesis protein [Methanolinea mesophila]